MANYRFAESETSDEKDTLTWRAYESLRLEILSGEFAPGDRLVRRTLSKRLGVSPMPVTEALHMLESADDPIDVSEWLPERAERVA